MVRRQTMQIEAEKRALLRVALIGVSVLLAGSLLLTAWMYRQFSSADSQIKASEFKAATFEKQLQEANRELEQKKAMLDANAEAVAKQNAVIDSVVPKMLNKTARDSELGELAHAIFLQSGHSIKLAGIPPDSVLRRYRFRVDGRPHSYIMLAGLVDGKWVLYSFLVKNQAD